MYFNSSMGMIDQKSPSKINVNSSMGSIMVVEAARPTKINEPSEIPTTDDPHADPFNHLATLEDD